MSQNEKLIAVIGLGYVGLPLAVAFGKRRKIVGFDINQIRISELKAGFDRTRECTTEEILEAKGLIFTDRIENLFDCEIFIITVPTPVDSANRPDVGPLVRASEIVGAALKKGGIVIYESTVYPGATEEVCVPALERSSGLRFNHDFFCGYSPERINPGDKVNKLEKIKKITSGSTVATAAEVNELYRSIIAAGTFQASSIKVAEAAKVIENAQRDLNIAFVNELSMIFDRLRIDTLEVLEAAGTKWNFLPFRPGMVGGHCIGVDPYYLTHKAEQLGYHPEVLLAGRRINDNMARFAAKNIIKRMIKNRITLSGSVVGVLGVTFKDNCPDIRNSKVVDLIEELKDWGVGIVVVDPWADQAEVRDEYGLELGIIDSKNPVDSIVVAVGHDEFKRLHPRDLRAFCRQPRPVLGDIKSIYDRTAAETSGFTVYRL